MRSSRYVDSKQIQFIFVNAGHILPQTMHHESCRAHPRPQFCISSSTRRRARTSDISRNYCVSTAPVSFSLEREKNQPRPGQERPDHENPLAGITTQEKEQGAKVKINSPTATSPKFSRRRSPGKHRAFAWRTPNSWDHWPIYRLQTLIDQSLVDTCITNII